MDLAKIRVLEQRRDTAGLCRAAHNEEVARRVSLRIAVARSLGCVPATEESLDCLLALVRDEARDVRIAAILALRSAPVPRAATTLAGISRSGDAVERAWAAQTLGRIGLGAAVPALRDALRDPDGTVRAYAAEALGRLQSRDSIDDLIVLLADPDRLARRDAALALARIRDVRGTDALEQWLKTASLRDRRAVRRMLADP